MDTVTPSARRGPLFYVGAAGLLAVMVIEAIAVVGCHSRLPLLGALEMAQAAIVPAACASMIIASLAGGHAVVHLVIERLPARLREITLRASALLAALFFAALTFGAGWLAVEYWDSFEESDVLHIPFRPLRVLVFLCTGVLSAIFFARSLRARAPR